jgi:YidC/Oxa1 family membrane protein insertase
MDRKSIILLVASLLLILMWQPLVSRFYPPVPVATNVLSVATNSVASTNTLEVAPNNSVVKNSATPFDPNAPEQILTVTNEEAIYTFTSHGGGLKSVQLRQYPAVTREKKVTTNAYASLNAGASVAVMTLLGGESLQGDGTYELTQTGNGVRAEKSLPNGLTITKDFTFGSNYLFTVKARLENHGKQNIILPAHEWVIGTATAMSEHDKGDAVGFFYNNGSKVEEVKYGWFLGGGFLMCKSSPKSLYESETAVAWADVHNQFFTLATVPKEPAQKLISRKVELPNASHVEAIGAGGMTNGLQTSLIYPHSNLAAGQAVEKQFTVYAGPKEYNTLAKIADSMKNDLDKLMGFNGFFGFFAKTLLLSMNGLHALFGGALSYGWIIILITVLIKLLFWPLTNASTKSMKRMQAFQPQLKALQEKYKDDKAKLSRKQMEFFKEHKINPAGGCLPMLIQIPVFIGFYTMIRSAIELRGVSFLWAFDLSQADTVGHIAGFPINILPIIYGLTLLYQARITPVSPTMDPSQQQMMKYMPLMFLFILYNMSAGLTLYWTVQNSLTILQTKLTKATDTTTSDGKTQVQIIPPKKKK